MNASSMHTFVAASRSCRASAALRATGFSHSTCLPAAAAWSVTGTCKELGSGL